MHDTLLLFGATGDPARRHPFPPLLRLRRERPEDGDDRDAAVLDDLRARIDKVHRVGLPFRLAANGHRKKAS